MAYAGVPHNLREIGLELGATHIIEGSVRRMGGRVRVTAQLIEARSDEHIWADRYDRDLDDIFVIQSQFADAWSRLAWAHASRVHFRYGEETEELATADRALARAKVLAPGRAETLLAEAYVHYHERKDYGNALAVLGKAIEQEPNNADLLSAEAFVLRRMGRFNDARRAPSGGHPPGPAQHLSS